MSNRKPADSYLQPRSFVFTAENKENADKIISKYPEGRQQSAVIALLYLAQNQNSGWVPLAAMDYIADYLKMPKITVYEVASFYTMFNLKPVGKYHIQLCGTTPCWLRGSDELKNLCKKKLKIGVGETTEDGIFTLSEVECLGACANAPAVQINEDYFEDLDPKNFAEILDILARGEKPKLGSQIGRKCSAPEGADLIKGEK